MRADLVHSVLAAGMAKPSLLAAWQDAPEALSRFDVCPESFDLVALRQFAGLAFKVRHNALRGQYGNTFRLLRLVGLEIELFADYACACSKHGLELAAQNEARARALVQFIGTWHSPSLPQHVLLWDMVRHEHAVSELEACRQGPDAAQPRRDAASRLTLESKLHRCGAMRFQEFRHNRLDILAAMHNPMPDLASLETGAHRLVHWLPHAASAVQLVELDEFGFAMLQAADGQCSLGEFATLLNLRRSRRPQLLDLAHQLVQAGLLAGEPTDTVAAP